jgi:hypothetical protein
MPPKTRASAKRGSALFDLDGRRDCLAEETLKFRVAHRIERGAAQLGALFFSANIFFFP